MEIKHVVGPHRGWNKYSFHYWNRYWDLLTIDNGVEAAHSLLGCGEQERETAQPWPHYKHLRLDGILSVESAMVLIQGLFSAYENGVIDGRVQKENEIKEVLGL